MRLTTWVYVTRRVFKNKMAALSTVSGERERERERKDGPVNSLACLFPSLGLGLNISG